MTAAPPSTASAVPEGLRRAVAAGKVSPAYLWEGSDADALRAAALEFAASLLCRRAGCGTCRSCRLARAERHPDLHVLGKDKATVISVDALVPVLERAYTKPLEGARQVFLVDPADALEPEGTARYLKALEEPPEGTVFVLLSTRPERLPETVLSRCRRVRLPPPTASAIEAALRADGVAADLATNLARWSGGSLARARRMARAGLADVARSLAEAAFDASPRTGRAAADALKALEGAAGGEEVQDEERDGKGREALRAMLQDLLLLLGVEARDVAAGRAPVLLAPLASERGLSVLERLGFLSGAVAANATPAAVLIDVVATLRAARAAR